MSSRPWRVRSIAAGATIVAVGLLAACGSNGNHASNSSGPSGTVTVLSVNGNFVANFNPFSPSAQVGTFGEIYEPLLFLNTAKAGSVQPWLATTYSWSDGGKSITFQLRHGVKWSDGKPFTSADVAYLFQLEKSNSALNQYGLPLAGTSTSGPYSVTIDFTKPAYQDLYLFGGRTYMIPEHIWKNIKNPANNLNSKPVGTGAYQVQSVSPQVLTLTANPHYYLPGLPRVKTYRILNYTGTASQTAVENGTLGWAGAFISNINKVYLAKDPKYALVDIPLSVTYLIPNMVKGPQTALPVRQAISLAIDRGYISQAVYNGYAPAVDPEGLILPNFRNIASPAALSDKFGGANAAAARKVLQQAGYKMGGNGFFTTPSGQPLTINVKLVTGYTDYISILQIMQSELKSAGIKLTYTQEAYPVWAADQNDGNFQFLISNAGYTPSPYSYFYNLLASAVTRPLGQGTGVFGNYGRYHNSAVDALLANIAGTTDLSAQKPAFYQLENLMKTQLPDIPLMEGQDEIEFNGHMVSGWPTKANPYAAPPIWLQPDGAWVADRLRAAS